MQSPTALTSIVKVAVQANGQSLLFNLNQDQPLDLILQDICQQCNVKYEINRFALQLLPQASHVDSFKYITETNRCLIKNGHELRMIYSPSVLSKMIKVKLDIKKESIENLSWALKKAANFSSDMTFCKEFYHVGYPELRQLLNESNLTKELFNNVLQTVLNLIKSNYLKNVDKEFLAKLKTIITSNEHIDEGIVEKALAILEATILSKGNFEFDSKFLDLDHFKHHIWNRDMPSIQSNALAVINAMCLKCSNLRKKRLILMKMDSTSLKDDIYMNIIQTDSLIPSYLAHELYKYQSLTLTLQNERHRNLTTLQSALSTLLPHFEDGTLEAEVRDEIEKLLFGFSKSVRKSSSQNDYKDGDDLSFTTSLSSSVLYGSDEEDDSEDDLPVPTTYTTNKLGNKGKYLSKLTFQCVCYFFTNHKEDYNLALLEDGDDYQRFLQTCDQIAQLLCAKILKVGNIPENAETNYCPLFFLTQQPFVEELFSKSINLFLKTKREMKAKSSTDLEKVYQVLQRQLTEAMLSQPLNYDQLDSVLATLSYWTVRNQWQEEHSQRERDTLANSPAIQQLRQSLVPQTKQLISKQRLQWIKSRTEFPVWNVQRNQRVKNKTWWAYLTANEKTIVYYENKDDVHQLPLKNVVDMLTGKRCPHIKESKSRATSGELAFSLITEESSLDFIAPTQEIYDNWTDAMNSLLGREMKSIMMTRDLKCLLEMEVRLRLLDTEGLELPSQPPPIPLAPPNYDFSLPDKS